MFLRMLSLKKEGIGPSLFLVMLSLRLYGGHDGKREIQFFVMKESDYDMKLMATYGSLTYHPDEKNNTRYADGETHTFKYAKPFADHFKYRHQIDDHNNLRHSSPSFFSN